MLSFFPRGVLDEILNLIESVSEGFPSYSFVKYFRRNTLCSPGGHIVSADPVTMYHVIVRLRTLAMSTGLKLTISFYKGARDERRE